MPQLAQELNVLRRQARRLILVRGLAVFLAAIFGLAILGGLVDYIVRWQEAGARWLQSLAWFAVVALLTWRYLVRPWRAPLTNIDLARAIHRRWPTQTSDLIHAVEFEESRLASAQGAPLLQQVTISRGQLQLATVPWRTVIWPTRAYLAVAAAVLSVGVVVTLFSRATETAGVGACRLVMPWSRIEWPRRTNLEYLDSELRRIDLAREPAFRAAQGEMLTLYVTNRSGNLPNRVEYQRKHPNGEIERGELRQSTLRDAKGEPRQVAVATFPASESFAFRAEGGDDDRAPWLNVRVVPPPRVDIFHISLTPPAYTGLPVEQIATGVGHVQGLVGTQVDIRAVAAAPLQSVNLNRGNEPRRAIPLSADGIEFKFGWQINTAERSTYWLDMADPEGVRSHSPPRHEIRGVADQPPVVSILSPESDLRVSPQAEIQISGEARDDLGLQRVELVYEIPGLSGDGQASVEQHSLPLGPERDGATLQPISMTWKIAELGLPPGIQVRFWLQGTDKFDLNGAKGQVGRSAVRVLSILSLEDKLNELSGKQKQLAEKMAPLRDRQAAVEESTREIQEQWKIVGALRSEDGLSLDRIQAEQKEIARQLSSASQGILGELRNLISEFQQNQIPDTTTQQSLQEWEEVLAPLVNDVLPQVEENLQATRRGAFPLAGGTTPQAGQVAESIEQAHDGQTRTLQDLDGLTRDLASWKRDRDLDKRFAEIARQQTDLKEQSMNIGLQTSAKRVDELTPQEQADIARVADRQNSLARDVERFMSQLSARPPNEPASAVSSAEEAMARKLSELGIAAAMQDIAERLRRNHIQSATEAQSQLIESLEALRQGWEQERKQTAKNDVEQLKKALADVSELARMQRRLKDQTEAMSAPSADTNRASEVAELQREQGEAAARSSELAERLRRERRTDASAAARRAEQRMQEAGEELEQESMASALEHQTEAVDELEQTQDELNEELSEAKQRADLEQMAATAELIKSLIDRTIAARDEMMRVEEIRLTQGKWTRSQLKSIQRLADSQQELAETCGNVAGEFDSGGIMSLCLNLATEHQRTAAGRLRERETGAETQAELETAQSLLEQFLASLTPSPNSGEQSPESGDDSASMPSSEEAGSSTEKLSSEVRLLLNMQEDILSRTRVLAEQQATGHPWTDAQVAEHQRLRDRQRKLTEAAKTILQMAEPLISEPDTGLQEESK